MQALFAGVGALVLGALSWVVFSADSWSTTANHVNPPAATSDTAPPSLAPKLPPPSTANAGAAAQPIATLVPPPSAAGFAAKTGNSASGANAGANPPPNAPAPGADARKSEPNTNDALAPLEIKPRRPYRDREKKDQDKDKDGPSASTASKSAKNNAIAKVKVFPWGRVWVDGKLQGSVPPILEVNLTPGTHEIAVGHERPMESRSVSLAPGATQLVAFDLEGR
jgi:hypothetical protein